MLENIKKVHFIGVGGIGVSAIAKMMLLLGKKVFGSDIAASEITDDLKKRGIEIFIGHRKENIDRDNDLIIFSPAVPENNPELLAAKEFKIEQLSYPEFLGELSKNYFTIAVSGTNGKTTTTAMLGLILEKAGLDPTVIVGSEVKSFPDGNFRLGKSKYLVVEGCEWNAHMLKLNPQMIVLTNLEEDHLDYYKDINDIISHFQKYIDKLPKEGKLILNNDDQNLAKKLFSKNETIFYGINNPSQVMAEKIETKEGFQKFNLSLSSKIYNLKLSIPGLFNVYNALAAVTAAIELGIKPEIIKKALEEYRGAWRRFEVSHATCNTKHVTIISDYAHHPTAIRGTIKAAKEFYPGRRLFVVFQPHHHNRTKTLFNDFVKSFDQADLIIIPEIYGVAGRELKADGKVSSYDLVEAIKKITDKKVIYAKDLVETKELILENIKDDDVLLIMGAGDIYKVAEELK
jgi:UDP-N-acetylmuramate--alanine ligase